MSAADEEARAELWRIEQATIAAKRAAIEASLAGSPAARAALDAKWQPLILALQEADNGRYQQDQD